MDWLLLLRRVPSQVAKELKAAIEVSFKLQVDLVQKRLCILLFNLHLL
jgi:hypothetical protein